jgi:outer membrane usher protein
LYCAALWLASAPRLQAAAAVAPDPAGFGVHQSGASQRVNSAGHSLIVTVPVTDGGVDLGDIAVTIDPDDAIAIPSVRLLDLLSAVVDPKVIGKMRQRLAQQSSIGTGALAIENIVLRYDSRTIELTVDVPARLRLTRTVQVAPLARGRSGDFERPATLSSYLNIRSSFNYVEQGGDHGFAAPVVALDEATRFKGVVFETQGTVQPGAVGGDFQRQDSRLVFDDRENLLRWSIGDLSPVATGFQSAAPMTGISLFRSYSVLQPEMIARPTGMQSFTLQRPSTVEVWVNGRSCAACSSMPGPSICGISPSRRGSTTYAW